MKRDEADEVLQDKVWEVIEKEIDPDNFELSHTAARRLGAVLVVSCLRTADPDQARSAIWLDFVRYLYSTVAGVLLPS
ncbi:hypothetical protein JCM8547_007909 [Rhodosporidiobolus lusitaniae]